MKNRYKNIYKIFAAANNIIIYIFIHSVPANASSTLPIAEFERAEKLIQADAMLMAMSQRCHLLQEPFDREYALFHRNYKSQIAKSSKVVRSEYGKRHNGASLDTMLTATANAFGKGHPLYSCEKLRGEMARIVELRSSELLYEAISSLLTGAPRHDHDTENITSTIPSKSPLPEMAPATAGGSAPDSASSPKVVALPIKKSPKDVSAADPAITNGRTQDYTGGSRIKDF